jgi:hypothetical protein
MVPKQELGNQRMDVFLGIHGEIQVSGGMRQMVSSQGQAPSTS